MMTWHHDGGIRSAVRECYRDAAQSCRPIWCPSVRQREDTGGVRLDSSGCAPLLRSGLDLPLLPRRCAFGAGLPGEGALEVDGTAAPALNGVVAGGEA